jgi:flagellar biosynthesis GTPase FlhF
MTPADQTFTYRGRSLEELVPRIRSELGDDAVIVARRETTSGGVGGFFAKREIEVDVRPGESAPLTGPGPEHDEHASAAARAFAQQLAQAQKRQQAELAPARPAVSSAEILSPRPATSPEVDALPRSSDVSVDDLFPQAPPAKAQGLAALFNAGIAGTQPEAPVGGPEPEPAAQELAAASEPEPEPEPGPGPELELEPAAPAPPVAAEGPGVPEPEGPITFEWPARSLEADAEDSPAAEPAGAFAPHAAEDSLAAEPAGAFAPQAAEAPAAPEPPAVEQPTGMFDYVGVDRHAVEPAPEQPAPAAGPVAAGATAAPSGLPPAARAAVQRLADRGLRPELAEAVAEEAMAALHPLLPSAEPRDLVLEAMARRIPMHPLRRGPGVAGFVGPAGAGKTRCVARLAAAHARHGALPVTVLALRSPDGGAELTRLLAPYGVTLHAVGSGAEGAARIASLRGEQLVIVDTPGVSPRSSTELRSLRLELDALAPDELHLTVSATVGPAAARELVRGVRELGVGALAVTHVDETEMLGTVIGLAIDCSLPMSFLARGQAVDAGLQPASARELAEELLP